MDGLVEPEGRRFSIGGEDYEVKSASLHDSQVFETLLDEDNSSRDVWADSAYRSEEKLEELGKRRFRDHLQRKGCKHKKLTE
jgi:IS5 family transposase